MYLLFSQDIYKVLDDVLGQGAHTTVKSCVNLATNQEYAVKVKNYFLLSSLIIITWLSFGVLTKLILFIKLKYYVALENIPVKISVQPCAFLLSLWLLKPFSLELPLAFEVGRSIFQYHITSLLSQLGSIIESLGKRRSRGLQIPWAQGWLITCISYLLTVKISWEQSTKILQFPGLP